MTTKLNPSQTWVNRWEVNSHSSDRTYIVAQKVDGTWGCAINLFGTFAILRLATIRTEEQLRLRTEKF